MRRLCITLLCGLVAVPAALAGARATGDGTLELSNVNGTATLNGTRGTLWGQMSHGKIVATDPVTGDGQILVSGFDSRTSPTDAPNITIYSGAHLRFRVTGGKYRLWMKGTDIDLTAVGVGISTLVANPTADDPGQYALDGGKWIDIPQAAKTVPFGEQTPSP